MQKIWKIKERTRQDLIAQLLENRGLATPQQIQDFLNPDYSKLHSPFLFKDMRKAVDRIWDAILRNQKILIYSDYDADAITSNALLFRTFQFFGIKPEIYIPDRFTEGYGLNLEAFAKIKEQGADVVITVDCGTNSVAEADFCLENGIDLIITDHHELTGAAPKSYALINPKIPGEEYPYNQLTGVGVAFKLACALLQDKSRHGFAANGLAPAANIKEGYEKWLLDLVAIGTVADCHSLLGENRVLVKYGLQVLAKTKWPGLRALMLRSGLAEKAAAGKLDAYSIGFVIAPRINAAGRIDHAKGAFDLLVCDDYTEAVQLAAELERLNSHRQMLTETVMSEARLQIGLISERKILLAVGDNWPKGVVGLVAGRLCEEYAKPVLVLERGEVESTGSARSVPAFNIVSALNFSRQILVKYGGHAAAAGFTLKSEHIDLFYKNILDFAERNLADQDLVKIREIDAEIFPEQINIENAEMIERFGPFGIDNQKPKLMVSGVEIRDMTVVGKDQKHLQMEVSVPGGNGSSDSNGSRSLKCIGFNLAKSAQGLLRIGQKIDLAVELMVDEWNGRKNIKLKIIDFRKAMQ